uniref:hypothetical protein n=1 Tax=Xanthomonas sp. 0924 TaxID=2835534 RepID=UPI003F80B1D8
MSTEIKCTCPSGDGSLRWPCPAHQPSLRTSAGAAIAVQPVSASDLLFGHPRELFRVTPAGDVVVSEGVSTTDAARAFWDAVSQMRPRLDAAGLKELSGNSGQLQQAGAVAPLNEPFGNSEQLAPGALDYALGRLDREAPQRVWLQIDTAGENSERDVPWPGSEHVTWQDESIGGLEVEYVRADLTAQPAADNGGAAPIDVTDPWRGLYLAENLRAHSEYGDVYHPDTPSWPDDREDALDKLVHAQGFDFHIVAGDFSDEAIEDGDELYWQEMRAWSPEAPEGEWRLAWKGDTEDGPYAWFVRPMALRPEPEAPATSQTDAGSGGDALVLTLKEMRARLTDVGSPARTAALDAAIAALVARQPSYVQGSDELRARTDGERAAYMEGLEEGKRIAARQPVGIGGAIYQVRYRVTDGWTEVSEEGYGCVPSWDRRVLYTTPPAHADRMAIKMLVAAGFVSEDKANESLRIAHGFGGDLGQPAPAAVPVDGPLSGKYGTVLRPFVAMMERELHANAGKGDRPGWLSMDSSTALLEIYHHMGKLQRATKNADEPGIVEYAADVANMAMMLVDVCGLLPVDDATHPQPAAACVNINAMRYLYLRAQPVEGGPWGTPRIAIPSSERGGQFANGEDADAAIDAAIAAQHAHGGDA